MAEEKKYEVPVYNDTYRTQQQDAYNAITNRKPFTYDVNGDALYQQYRDKYIQGGKMAMKDTMGQAAALTGGYGSSYGQAVGQQQYDAYLQNLNDVVPQLYETAYQRYRDQGTDLEKQYAMLGDMANDEYAKYRDQMQDYRYNQEWDANRSDVAYKQQQDAYSKLYSLILSTGYKPTNAELKAAGMSKDASKALLKAYKKANGGGGGGGGYSSSGVSISSSPNKNNGLDLSALDKIADQIEEQQSAAAAQANPRGYGQAFYDPDERRF